MEYRNYTVYNQDVNQISCTATLQNKVLWKQFNDLQTEMIITKSGRRMFPALRVQLYELDPTAIYCVLLEMVPVEKCRYKYSSSTGWAPAGSEEAQSPNRVYLHPESPANGEQWMSQPISFGKMKLTNTSAPPSGHLVLSSMHKYQPRILIVKAAHPRTIAWAPSTSIVFKETQFIAVTAYQNDKITKLKIDNNPFAKGFRENGQSKCKRKRILETEDDKKQEAEFAPEKLVDDREAISTPTELRINESKNASYSSPIPHYNYYQPHFYVPHYHQNYNIYSYYLSQYYHYPGYNFSYSTNNYTKTTNEDVNMKKKDPNLKKLTDFSINAIMNRP